MENIDDLLRKDNSTLVKQLKNLQEAIKSIKEEMKEEYEIEQKEVYFTYIRPHSIKQKKNKAQLEIDDILKNFIGKKEVDENLKNQIESDTINMTVPKTSAMRFTSIQSLKILSFILELYKEEEKKLQTLIKEDL